MGQEVDFMIHGYLKLNFFGSDVYITTTHVCLCIICLTLIALGLVVSQKMKHAKAVPDGIQNVAEFYVEMLDGMVKGSMFRHWGKYANYILTIFMFILFSNIFSTNKVWPLPPARAAIRMAWASVGKPG